MPSVVASVPEDLSGSRVFLLAYTSSVVVACTRSAIQDAIERRELQRRGIFVLLDNDRGSTDAPRLQVGQDADVRSAIERARSAPDPWTDAVVYSSLDSSLGDDDAEYLLGRFIDLAHTSARVTLTRSTETLRPQPARNASELGRLEDQFWDLRVLMFAAGLDFCGYMGRRPDSARAQAVD